MSQGREHLFKKGNRIGEETRFGGRRCNGKRFHPPDVWNKVFKIASGEGLTDEMRKQLGIPKGLVPADGIAHLIMTKALEGHPFFIKAYLDETQRRMEKYAETAAAQGDGRHVVVVMPGVDGAPELPGEALIQKLRDEFKDRAGEQYDEAEKDASKLLEEPAPPKKKPKGPLVGDP